MAKKVDTGDPVAILGAKFSKEYGEGVFTDANEFLDEDRQVIPVSPAIDDVLYGGLLEGTFVSLASEAGVGKTSTALAFAANAMRPEYGARNLYIADVECRMKALNLKTIKGLDLSKVYPIRSTATKIMSGQDYLQAVLDVLKGTERSVVLIDSVSALCPETRLTEGIGGGSVANGARIVADFVSQAMPVVRVRKHIVIGVVHFYANIGKGQHGPDKLEKAGKSWRYFSDVSLSSNQNQGSPWKVGSKEDGRQIGLRIFWRCNKSSLGPVGRTCESFIRFGVGVDRVYEAIIAAKHVGLITDSTWAVLKFMEKMGKEPVKLQGMDKVYKALVANPEWADFLFKELNTIVAMRRQEVFAGSDDEVEGD